MDTQAIVRRNAEWFINSGVMHPSDGYWGVAERLITGLAPDARERVNASFPFQTELGDDVTVIEHRRADCNFQAAYAFDLAAQYLNDERYKAIADGILDFCLKRSNLLCRDAAAVQHGLWDWSQPVKKPTFYIDDNAWVITLLMLLGRTRPELRAIGLASARKLLSLISPYIDFLDEHGIVQYPNTGKILQGTYTNPHWMGLVTMAFAHAAAVDMKTDYASVVERYHEFYALAGPPMNDRYAGLSKRGLPWSLSEYAYLALTASICARRFKSASTARAARSAADILVDAQQPSGNFPAEHGESPAGEHLVDCIYTQNWATLGLQHAAIVFNDERYRTAAEKSFALLAKIQDTSASRRFAGCWRGMYDMRTGTWGGGDHYEGGAGSIYTGWTNAPIMTAFLLRATGGSLFTEYCGVGETPAATSRCVV